MQGVTTKVERTVQGGGEKGHTGIGKRGMPRRVTSEGRWLPMAATEAEAREGSGLTSGVSPSTRPDGSGVDGALGSTLLPPPPPSADLRAISDGRV